MVGCQTSKTSARFSAAQQDVQTCMTTIAGAERVKAENQPTFKDARDAMMYLLIQQMQTKNAYAPCTEVYIAMIHSDSKKTQRLISGGTTLGGIGLGLVGVKILADGITELANPAGSTNGDTFNSYNSRVVNRSSNSSASGEGLGVANVTGGRSAQGGIQPRQQQWPDSGDTNLDQGSFSGEDAPITLPVEPVAPDPGE